LLFFKINKKLYTLYSEIFHKKLYTYQGTEEVL
jgi:hypothetical protein